MTGTPENRPSWAANPRSGAAGDHVDSHDPGAGLADPQPADRRSSRHTRPGPLRIGLTGGTGSGKSTLARTWHELGAHLIDADQLAREVVEPGTTGLAQIVAEFGSGILDEHGGLRRADLAAIVFADPGRLRALEAITDPLIRARFDERLAEAGAAHVVVHDMPLIVERATQATYHLVVVVDAPEQVRVERLRGRGMSPEDATRRIAAQASAEQRRAAADVWVDNSGSSADLDAVARRLWVDRLVPFAENLATGSGTAPVLTDTADPTWPAQADRLAARITSWTGQQVSGAHWPNGDDLPGPDLLTFTIAAAPGVAERLPAAGFAVDETTPGRYASADPGRPAHVLMS
ncbi:MAG: dephospho-CoA kinase [Actinomycetales bacterium]